MVRVRGVTKRYERTIALAGVDLDLEAGTCTLLLGPNGAGKSTLMGVLSTTVKPTRGEVSYGDLPGSHPGVRGAIGLLAHGPMIYGDLTARENLLFFSRLYGVGPGRVQTMLERVGLAEQGDRLVRTFSRGMTQRLALARALLHDPALLLLDEPLTGLDARSASTLLELMAGLKAQGGILVVVTHRPDPMAGLADRVVVLDGGRVVHQGPCPSRPSELLG